MTELLGIDSLVNPEKELDFRPNLIKEYRFWFLLLNDDQRLIGRSYAWSKIPGEMQDLAFLHRDAYLELQVVAREWCTAMKMLIGMTHANYEWLGNEFQMHDGHGHMHMIPRFWGPFDFLGEHCEDPNFGPNGGTRHDKPVNGVPLEKRALLPGTKKQLIGRMREQFPKSMR